jgi:hypothetical protein
MVVFSNQRLGPSAELFVSDEVAAAILRDTAAAARPYAEARWEVELVLWLDSRADAGAQVLDVADIAWTPDHFDAQRRFVVAAIKRAGYAHAVIDDKPFRSGRLNVEPARPAASR